MSKDFLIFTGSNAKKKNIIRENLHQALLQELLVEEIDIQNQNIEITESGHNAKLKKVCITDLEYSNSKCKIDKIWKINLEKNIPGISVQGSTVEIALLVLQNFGNNSYNLNIILIELKSTLQATNTKNNKSKLGSLQQIEDKFRCSMNRLYMLLALNNHLNPKYKYDNSNISVEFRGVIFYLKNQIKNDDGTELYSILNQTKTIPLLSCATIIREQDKIKVKFISKANSDQQEEDLIAVKLKELIKF